MNITQLERDKRLSFIREAVKLAMPLGVVADKLRMTSVHVRDFMVRNNIALPKTWMPRPKRAAGSTHYVKKYVQSAAHRKNSLLGRTNSFIGMEQVADPSILTDEHRRLADKLRISHPRMAYLLQCPNSGRANGWNGGSSIG